MATRSSSSKRGRTETTTSTRTKSKIPKYSTTLKSSSTVIKSSISEPPVSSKSKLSTDKRVSQTFICDICVDHRPFKKSFPINGCSHYYCSDCVCKYVTSKIDSNIIQIPCPASDCKGSLEPEHCRSILPHKVFDRWGDALFEATIEPSRKFYCPFKDCSALLIKGSDYENIVKSECPICHRLFCAQCKVPWHSGIKCKKFQKYEREREGDILFEKLAKKKKWTQCPKCKFYVEKADGCFFMRCRCGYNFCYDCGFGIVNHYCSNCGQSW